MESCGWWNCGGRDPASPSFQSRAYVGEEGLKTRVRVSSGTYMLTVFGFPSLKVATNAAIPHREALARDM